MSHGQHLAARKATYQVNKYLNTTTQKQKEKKGDYLEMQLVLFLIFIKRVVTTQGSISAGCSECKAHSSINRDNLKLKS